MGILNKEASMATAREKMLNRARVAKHAQR